MSDPESREDSLLTLVAAVRLRATARADRSLDAVELAERFRADRAWLERAGVDASTVRQYDDVFTASFFVNTDTVNKQIASFYTGAMARARALWGGILMLLSAGGMYYAFGFNVFTMFPIAFAALAVPILLVGFFFTRRLYAGARAVPDLAKLTAG